MTYIFIVDTSAERVACDIEASSYIFIQEVKSLFEAWSIFMFEGMRTEIEAKEPSLNNLLIPS